MTVITKHIISTGDGKGGKIVVPKGAQGIIKGISNSIKILAAFPHLEHRPDGWFFIVTFPDYIEELLCDRTQVDIV